MANDLVSRVLLATANAALHSLPERTADELYAAIRSDATVADVFDGAEAVIAEFDKTGVADADKLTVIQLLITAVRYAGAQNVSLDKTGWVELYQNATTVEPRRRQILARLEGIMNAMG